jgi:hypothetical protein
MIIKEYNTFINKGFVIVGEDKYSKEFMILCKNNKNDTINAETSRIFKGKITKDTEIYSNIENAEKRLKLIKKNNYLLTNWQIMSIEDLNLITDTKKYNL